MEWVHIEIKVITLFDAVNNSNWKNPKHKQYAKESNEFTWHTHSVILDQDPLLLQSSN